MNIVSSEFHVAILSIHLYTCYEFINDQSITFFNHRKNMNIPLYATVLAILALGLVKSQCLRHHAIYTVRYGNCQPRRILVRACKGGCFTHARPSQTSPTEMMHFCQCCQQDDVIRVRTFLLCPSGGSSRRFRTVPFPVTMAESCTCRPCSILPNTIIPSEGKILQRSIREINATLNFTW